MRNFSCYFRTTIIKSVHIPSVCHKNAAKPRRRECSSSPANAKQPTPSPYPDHHPQNSGKTTVTPRQAPPPFPPKARKKAPASRRGRQHLLFSRSQLSPLMPNSPFRPLALTGTRQIQGNHRHTAPSPAAIPCRKLVKKPPHHAGADNIYFFLNTNSLLIT